MVTAENLNRLSRIYEVKNEIEESLRDFETFLWSLSMQPGPLDWAWTRWVHACAVEPTLRRAMLRAGTL